MIDNKTLTESDIISFSQYKMKGGIHPEQQKKISSEIKIQTIPLAKELLLAIDESEKQNLTHLVRPGELLSYGQKLFNQVNQQSKTSSHLPCDSEVLEISEQDFGHSTGLLTLSVRLKTLSDTKSPVYTSIKNWETSETQSLLDRIKEAAIVGLGGAVFPTHLKLDKHEKQINTLIVNAMECEPYITCDDRLLREQAEEILQGSLITAKVVGASNILFGIEDNKPEAINKLNKAILKCKKDYPTINIKIIIAPTIYPSGGEKQLIQLLTGKQVPQGKHPSSLGIIVQNIATLYAIYQAVVEGFPLTHRLVTITGNLVKKPGNYWVPFGTPVSHVISSLEINNTLLQSFIIGGPLMGQTISNTEYPIQKSTNCLIFNTDEHYLNQLQAQHKKDHLACIRCGECEIVCPAELLPQQLYWFTQSEQWDPLQEHSLFDCIECGACSYVCPSNIPLVDYYRFAKSKIKSIQIAQEKSEIAKQRFENREARLTRLKQQRDEKRKKTAEARESAANNKMQDSESKKNAIKAALARVKIKKESNL